jgi:hypothetical protein
MKEGDKDTAGRQEPSIARSPGIETLPPSSHDGLASSPDWRSDWRTPAEACYSRVGRTRALTHLAT